MSSNTLPLTAGNHETASVEDLIRGAHARLDAAGVNVSASKVSKLVRKVHRAAGPTAAKLMIDGYIARDRHDVDLDAWATVYADPTGNTAAAEVDRQNAAIELMRHGHTLKDAARAAHMWEVADVQQ